MTSGLWIDRDPLFCVQVAYQLQTVPECVQAFWMLNLLKFVENQLAFKPLLPLQFSNRMQTEMFCLTRFRFYNLCS